MHAFLHRSSLFQSKELPETWEIIVEKSTAVLLSNESDECKKLATDFKTKMNGKYGNVMKIERMYNECLYKQYKAHKTESDKRILYLMGVRQILSIQS